MSYGKSQIIVEYRKAADIFELMDNTANWWEGFNDESYSQYWEKKFGFSKEDKKLFKKYQKLRDKYYNDPDQSERDPLKNRNGFFSTLGSINADPVAEAFYSSKTLSQAFKKLEKKLSTKEVDFLKGFYKHFEEKYSKILKESENFKGIVKRTQKGVEIKGSEKYLDRIKKFYDVDSPINYTVLFVWFPPLSRTNASPTGNYLIMRNHPIKHAKNDDTDIVFHEVVHSISAQQDLKKKKEFTSAFIKNCDPRNGLKKLRILEEPLAVATGQMAYQAYFQSKRFEHASKWYNNSWISMFGKLIYPTVKVYLDKNKAMDMKFINKVSRLCSEVLSATKSVHK